MNAFAFKVIDAINRDGMDNGSWGLVKDVDNTVAYFGTREEIELKGQWAYIYAEKDDTLSLQLEKIEPTRVLHVPVRFGRNTGEYRGQFDKLNIAMVLVGNRLYYVTFEKIEKL